ncbi:UNVERIFIED_CONTAM: hypothetical protein K2H54_047766 [Gekko kuhli]
MRRTPRLHCDSHNVSAGGSASVPIVLWLPLSAAGLSVNRLAGAVSKTGGCPVSDSVVGSKSAGSLVSSEFQGSVCPVVDTRSLVASEQTLVCASAHHCQSW